MGIHSMMAIAILTASCTFQSLQPPEARYRVALVDSFYPGPQHFTDEEDCRIKLRLHGVVDADRDWIREPYYHGDVVSMFVAHPSVAVIPYPVRDNKSAKRDILAALRRFQQQRDAGEPIDAVLLPWESSTLISAFEKPLPLEHVAAYKAQIRRWGESQASWRETSDIIDALETLVAGSALVYTIAGNGGRGMVNAYSFAEGVVTVGAVEPDLDRYVADNPFVDTHEKAAYLARLIYGAAGRPIGYDVNGDQCPGIPLACISTYTSSRETYPASAWRAIRGSSFAAPTALKRYLTAEAKAPTCIANAGATPR